MNIAGILLAAGGSARLGSPKQLLVYQGKTLLRRAAETVLAAGCCPVVAVLGRDAAALRAEFAGLDVQTINNPNWNQGMGTSVRLGVSALGDEADAALLTLCDQPLVTAEMLTRLLDAVRHAVPGTGLAAAAYNDTVGVPAVFGRAYFGELRALPDDAGAKPVLWRHWDKVVSIPLPQAATDIDTREQYEHLAAQRHCNPR